MCCSYRHLPQAAGLGVPVYVYGGEDDRLVPPHTLQGWAATAEVVVTSFLPGGHFLVSDDRALLRREVFTLTREIR